MASIDDRIVKMEFDNAQFEKGVAETTTSLDNLKKALKIDDATKSLDNLSKTVGKIDTSGLNDAADTVKNRFSALGTIATGALMGIGSAAASAGAQMLKSLTVQPLIDGFQEYETQMKSIQTIMANTADAFNDPMGESQEHLDAVNKKLDELNTYADKTIYNFSEMTRNIGTFTAAGVDLDTATSAIQGISNLAAVSGSTSAQASTAMYQLSQAIATGTVKLQDWNSVVNAGMGGKTFQDALIRTARHLNTGVDAAIKARGSFRESLRDGWLTSEVLTTTLKQMTLNVSTQEEYNNTVADLVKQGYTKKEAEQIASLAKNSQDAATKVRTFSQLIDTVKESIGSGWTQSWQIIIGDFNQASDLWTGVNDKISDFVNKTSDARNAALKMWADAGGRQAMIDGLGLALRALESQLGPLAEGFASIIPKDLPVQIANLMKQFNDWIQYFTFLPHAREELYQIGALIGNIFKTVSGAAFNVITGAIYGLKSIIDGMLHTILGIAGGIATLLNTGLQPLLLIIQHLSVWINMLLAKLGDFVGQQIIRRIGDTIELIMHRLEEFFEKLFEGSTFIQDFSNALDVVDQAFGKALDAILTFISKGLDVLSDVINGTLNVIFDVLDAGATGINHFFKNAAVVVGNIIDFLKELGSIIRDTFGKVFTTIGTQVVRVWDAIVNSFSGAASIFKPLIGMFTTFGDTTKGAFDKVIGGVRSGADAFSKFVDDVAPKVADFIIQNVIPAIQKFGSIAVDVFGKFASFVTSNIVPAVEKFASVASQKLGQVAEFIKSTLWPAIKDFGGKAQEAFGKLGEFIINKTVPAFEKFSDKARSVFDKFGNSVSDFKNTTKDGFSNASDYISAFGDSVGRSFGIAQDKIKPFTTALGVAADFIQGVLQKIVGFFKDAFGGVADAVSQFDMNNIPDSLMKLASAIGTAFNDHVIPAIQNGVELALNFLQTAFSGIGDKLVPLFTENILPAIADGLTQTGQGAIELLKSFIDGFFGDGFGLIQTAYGQTVDKATTDASRQTTQAMPNAFSGVGDAVKKMADGVAETLRGSAAGLADRIRSVVGGIKDAFLNVFGHDWEEVKERIDYVTNTILKASFAKFLSQLGDTLSGGIKIGKKLAAAVNNGAKALNNAMKGLKRLAGAAEIAAFAYAVGKIVDSISKMADVVKNNDIGTLSASIGIIVGILVGLGVMMVLIDKFTREDPVGKAATLGDGITGIMGALNQVGKGVKLAAIGFSIAMFGLSVKMIAEAFKTLQGMNLGDMAPGLFAFGLALGAFAVAVKVLNSESKNMLMAATSILELAISLQVIANVVQQVHDMIATDAAGFAIAAGVVALSLVGLCAAVIGVSKLAGGNGTGAIKGAAAVLILTIALKQFADVVKSYIGVPWDDLRHGTEMAAVGLAALSLSLIAVTRWGKDEALGKAAAAILTTAGSLNVFAEAVTQLSAIDFGHLAASVAALVIGLAAMSGALIALTKLGGSGGQLLMAAGALLMVSGALWVFGNAVSNLAGFDYDSLSNSVNALVSGLLAMTLALMALTNVASGGQLLMAAGSLLMVSGALWILADAVSNLASLNPDAVAQSMDVLGNAMWNMTAVLLILGNFAPGAILAGFAMIEVAEALKIVSEAVQNLTNSMEKFKDVGDAPENIKTTLTAIGDGLAAGKSGIDKFLSGVAVGEVCDALNQLAQSMDVWKDPALPTAAENIGKVVDGINTGLSSGDASGVGKILASWASNNVIGGLKDLAGAVGSYKDIGKAPDNIGKTLKAISQGLDHFQISNAGAISQAATGLSDLGPSLTYYSGLDKSVSTNLGSILSTLKSNLPGLSGIFAGPGANALPQVASGLNELSGCLDKYGSDSAKKASGAIGYLLDVIYTKMGRLGGLLAGPAAGALFDVASGLNELSGCLDKYATAGTAAANIGTVLDAIYTHLHPLIGILGGGSADVFAIVSGGLTQLGGALQQYNDMANAAANIGTILDTVSTGVVKFTNSRAGADAMAVAAGSLTTLAGALPQFNNISMGDIATQLGQLSDAINNFSATGANISTAATNMDSLAGACNRLGGTLQGTADAIGNLAGKFWDLSNNASNAIGVVPGLAGACDGLAGTLQGCADAIGNLAGKFWDLSNNAGPAISTVSNLAGACNGLEGPLQGTAAAIGNLAGKCWDLQNNASQAASAASGAFKEMCDTIGSSMQTAASTVSTSMQQIVDTVSQKASEAAQKAKEKGNETGQSFAQGISAHVADAARAANSLVSAATNGLNNGAGAAYAAGANISNSFADGLGAAVGRAQAAAASLAAAAQQAIEAKAKIGSPSKVAIWEGKMVGDGFVIGIKDRVSNVEDAAGRYASAAFNAIDRASDMISDVIDNQDYIMPITPVVDSSGIQNGINWSNYGLSTLGSYQLAVDGSAMAAQNRRQSEALIESLRADMKRYTNAVLNKDTYTYQMGNAVINDDAQIRGTLIDLITELNRRAVMNRG